MTAERKQQYILYFTMFQVLLGFGIVIPILPAFARDLGATSLHMGLLVTAWAGAQFLVSPFWGALSDRIGRRPVLLLGLIGYAVNFGFLSVSTDIWIAILVRFLGGMLSAATIPTAQAFVADTSTGAERTSRLASMSAAMNLGFLCGPPAGGLLSFLGYRGTLQAALVLGVINLVLAWIILPEPPRRQQNAVRRKGFSGPRAVLIALRGPEAIHYLMAFGGTFGGSTLFSMLGYFVLDRMGAGPEVLSIIFTLQGLVTALVQWLVVGRLSRTMGDLNGIAVALSFGILGFLILIFAWSIPVVILGCATVAIAMAMTRPLITSAVSRRTRLEQGMTMGIQTSFDALGRTLGPLFAGVIYLWRDWAPFATSLLVYAIFLVMVLVAARRESAQEEAPRAAD